METNVASVLREYEGEILVVEWEDGLRLRVLVDNFCSAEDNEDGLDSIILEVKEFLHGKPRGALAVGALLEIKENDPPLRAITPQGQIVWPEPKPSPVRPR